MIGSHKYMFLNYSHLKPEQLTFPISHNTENTYQEHMQLQCVASVCGSNGHTAFRNDLEIGCTFMLTKLKHLKSLQSTTIWSASSCYRSGLELAIFYFGIVNRKTKPFWSRPDKLDNTCGAKIRVFKAQLSYVSHKLSIRRDKEWYSAISEQPSWMVNGHSTLALEFFASPAESFCMVG